MRRLCLSSHASPELARLETGSKAEGEVDPPEGEAVWAHMLSYSGTERGGKKKRAGMLRLKSILNNCLV